MPLGCVFDTVFLIYLGDVTFILNQASAKTLRTELPHTWSWEQQPNISLL